MSGSEVQDRGFSAETDVWRGVRVRSHALIALLTGLSLVVSGVGFRFLGRPEAPSDPVPLRREFDAFPREFLGYKWQAAPLDEEIEKVAGATAYVNLFGYRERDGGSAHLYVSYYGEARTLIEHEPQVCMLAGGWALHWEIKKTTIRITPPGGGPDWELPINVYLFKKDTDYLLMLNYYRINSKYFVNRDEGRVISAEAGGRGFYTQTRVSLGLSSLEMAGISETNYADSDPVKRGVEILQFVVPALDDYLPVVTGAK